MHKRNDGPAGAAAIMQHCIASCQSAAAYVGLAYELAKN